jgi:hypothetical protein
VENLSPPKAENLNLPKEENLNLLKETTSNQDDILFVNNVFTIKCPWCNYTVQVLPDQINCKIFRCGNLKNNNEPINPHLPKVYCDYLSTKDLIFGCGKPFEFDGKTIKKCEYV